MTDDRSFEPGLGTVDPFALNGTAASTEYIHGNHLGTRRATTDDAGALGSTYVYTSFGERICPGGSCGPVASDKRYGYVGAWGYQAHDDFPYLHVGARYYDPASGRFLQRDPIGIGGGTNVYAYVAAAPTTTVDPDGLMGRGGKDRVGNDPLNNMTVEQLKDMKNEAPNTKAGKKLKQKLIKALKFKNARNIAKRVAKRVARKIPLVAAACFAYDWYNGGFNNAVREATWPFSELF